MRHPDLLEMANRLDAAVERGDERLRAQRESGDQSAETAAAYAQAEHAALVIVAYTRRQAQELDDTGLLAVPPPPKGLNLPLPEGMEWPTGFTCGPLTDANERKVAARAIAAHLQAERDRALNTFRCDRVATELSRDQVSAFQSVLRSETEEMKITTFHDPRPADADVGRASMPPPRRGGPPPPPRRNR